MRFTEVELRSPEAYRALFALSLTKREVLREQKAELEGSLEQRVPGADQEDNLLFFFFKLINNKPCGRRDEETTPRSDLCSP